MEAWFFAIAALVLTYFYRRRATAAAGTSDVNGPWIIPRYDSPPGQHRREGHILEWVRRRLRESPSPAREAFDALPLSHRRVFAARRLEAEVGENGFDGFLRGSYGPLLPDALEALRAFGADAHVKVVESALAARTRWLPLRYVALTRATASFREIEEKTPLMASRARYIEREAASFDGLV